MNKILSIVYLIFVVPFSFQMLESLVCFSLDFANVYKPPSGEQNAMVCLVGQKKWKEGKVREESTFIFIFARGRKTERCSFLRNPLNLFPPKVG